MPSADLCQPFLTPFDVSSSRQVDRSPRVRLDHLHAYARRIYVHVLRAGIGLQRYLPPHPDMSASYAVPVRQASALPAASFRSQLAMGTLAVRLTVPPAGSVEDFHLQVVAPCRAHKRKDRAISGPAPCLGCLYFPIYQIPTSAAPVREHT